MTVRKFLLFLLISGGVLATTLNVAHGQWERRGRHRQRTEDSASIQVDGGTRTYILHLPKVPDSGSTKPIPLLIVLHGGGGQGAGMAGLTGFNEIADREGFAVVYPDGLNHHWSDFRKLSDADDVGFIRALIEKLERENNIDAKRVYATGISNGGFFSNYLACTLTDKIAAIASVAATMPEGEPEQCTPSRPISVMYIHGAEDPIVHIQGGAILKTRGRSVSQDVAVQFWRGFDRTAEASPDASKESAGVHRRVYAGGKDGTEVVQYVVDGAGHVWPGGPQYLPAFIIGHASNAINASEVIWGFFKKNPRP